MAEYIKILQQQQCDFNNPFSRPTRQTWKDSYHWPLHGQIWLNEERRSVEKNSWFKRLQLSQHGHLKLK
jgi:hypothetical protein